VVGAMKSILYVSVADPALVSDDIYQLVGNAQDRNRADGISGIMLYNGSNFMQLIEGDPVVIDACFNRIAQDQRHSGVVTLRNDPVAVREFPEWAMRYSLVEQPVQSTLDAVRDAGAPRADTLDRIAAFVGLNRRGR
jgi:Sensors of blue-light using FAD